LRVDVETGKGEPPRVVDPTPGCRFRWRCPLAVDECFKVTPLPRTLGPNHEAACHVAAPDVATADVAAPDVAAPDVAAPDVAAAPATVDSDPQSADA
jgi:hypothetical protein